MRAPTDIISKILLLIQGPSQIKCILKINKNTTVDIKIAIIEKAVIIYLLYLIPMQSEMIPNTAPDISIDNIIATPKLGLPPNCQANKGILRGELQNNAIIVIM
jgi:hypothetical protein